MHALHLSASRALAPGIRYMVAGAFFFSLMSLGVKVAGQRLPTQEIVLVRGVVNVAVTYGMLRLARVTPWGSRPGPLLLRGLFGFLALSCLYYALVHLPLADATVLQYTNPVWTALLAVWVLDERMRGWEVLLVAASLLGVVVIARPSFLFGASSGLDLVAVGAALVGAFFSGAAYVTVRKLGRTEHPLVIVFYFTLVTIPGSLLGTLAGAVWPGASEWALLVAIALTAQAGQVYLTRGLQLEPAGRATAVGYLQIVFAAAWGALVFGERPDAWTAVGALLIVGSTLGVALARARPTVGRAEEAVAGVAT